VSRRAVVAREKAEKEAEDEGDQGDDDDSAVA
jgi:hypothetical protein